MSFGTVSGCRFVDNLPNGWAHGLGIYCAGGTLERSVFTRHNGGTTTMFLQYLKEHPKVAAGTLCVSLEV